MPSIIIRHVFTTACYNRPLLIVNSSELLVSLLFKTPNLSEEFCLIYLLIYQKQISNNATYCFFIEALL